MGENKTDHHLGTECPSLSNHLKLLKIICYIYVAHRSVALFSPFLAKCQGVNVGLVDDFT